MQKPQQAAASAGTPLSQKKIGSLSRSKVKKQGGKKVAAVASPSLSKGKKGQKGQKKKAAAVESASLTAAENNEKTMMALYGIKKSPKQGAAY